jgi:O-antigen/teichoic acid export membrane protein
MADARLIAGLTAVRPETRLRRWAGILSAFFTAQGLVQLAGIAAGILLVRTLPVREFALYTLALSVTTFFTFLSDLGSTGSLVHFFHRAAREGEDFQPYLRAVLSLRRAGFLLGAAAVAVVFPRAAAAKGYGGTEIALTLAIIVGTVWFQISAAVRILALRLADRYSASYRAEVSGALLRLLLTAGMVAGALLRAWIGVLASALGTALTAVLARRGGDPETALASDPGDLRPYRRRVLRYLLPTLPSALYFSIQGPLVVWLAATFGETRNIAEVGALTRLGMVVGLFSTLSGVVFLPRLARISDERLWRVRAVQFGGALLGVTLALLTGGALFPDVFLWVLGGSYAGLHRELVLVVAGAGLTLLDGYVVSVNLARSWTRWQGAAVVSLVAVQAALVALIPLGTTGGVLTFNLLSSAAALVLQLAIASAGFVRPERVSWK